MKVLVDEQVPRQFAEMLRFLLPAHEVHHVHDLRWKSKKDIALLRDARGQGFDVFVTTISPSSRTRTRPMRSADRGCTTCASRFRAPG